MKKVFVADPHPATRTGIGAILRGNREFVMADETDSGEELLHMLDPEAHDLLLLELRLKHRSGFEVLEDLHRRSSPIPVLVYSQLPIETYAVPAIRAGAAGILSKDESNEELLNALSTVARGRVYAPTVHACTIADVATHRPESGVSTVFSLSDRELQVYSALVAGKSIKEIAATMYVTPSSVITYRSRILKKMGLRTTQALLRYAFLRADYGL
jgi:two-component system, NarL family, invasion response regulator UvrY